MTTQLIGGYESATGKVHPLLATADGKLEVNTTGGSGGTQFDLGDTLPATATGTLLICKDNTGLADTLSVTAGGALRVDEAGITVGSDDTLTQAQQVLGYARKDASPSGLRALKCTDDGTLHNYDTGLNIKITNGSDATLSNAQQVLVYGRDSAGGVDALKVDNQGHLETVADYEQQVTSVFSGTQVIGASASHQFPTAIDKNGASQFEVLVSISTTSPNGNINIDVSDDDSTYYASSGVSGNIFSQNSSANFIGNTSRYAKVTIENTGTSSMTVTSVKATHINGL